MLQAQSLKMGGDERLENAISAFKLGNYDEAIEVFRACAGAGELEAQVWMGACYANGFGVTPSLSEGFAWYEKAAKQGHVVAATNVGAMLAMGQGVEQDRPAGVAWLNKAAEGGDVMACYNLATIYSKGDDSVPQDIVRAADLYRRAAESGHYPSQARLGYIYANGVGVEKDRVAAFAWFSLAAQHGVGTALNALESLVGQMSVEEKTAGNGLVQQIRGKLASATQVINPIAG